ncbi:DUF72 domain-containing protein [Nicoliella spurrieriana]|uniref:DUF72 domain-containing protein n=1 Tax=Nicoliella spurrieriana TaxID=2925830 RepID=A0A976X5V0_9LACO|nr:DUF72 domain-containing protein [Nicoliella spurrieriana]UQS87074.1 DUF72 domain-containing protein [Nicoliella spurrieriana]
MITIGLTTWTDHPAFSNTDRPPTLPQYASFLPTVEVDTPFYAIPRISSVENWQKQVPSQFQFILKANRLMTQHDLKSPSIVSLAERWRAFDSFKNMIQPLVDTQQLKTVLFQFPPFFEVSRENLDYLIELPKRLPGVLITVEFRHPSWYQKPFINHLYAGLKQLHITLAIVDEPHNLNDGIPFVPVLTNPDLAFIRLHGRNAEGWFNQGPDWRKKRTLYRYNDHELAGLAGIIADLATRANEVCIIFNNNSGKDAAPNALKLQSLLGLHFTGLAPKQLDLF